MTLFVSGIHAVGKTFLLKPVCERLGVRHATASQLIKEQRGLSNWTASRQVEEIDENQRALVAAMQRLEANGDHVVLDGHFVLRRSVGVHEEIDASTFAQLAVTGVLLLEAPSKTVADRLLQRGDQTWIQSEIDDFAAMELKHATAVCRKLGVPLVRLSSPSESDVQAVVARFIEESAGPNMRG